jgi:hypothetical protein
MKPQTRRVSSAAKAMRTSSVLQILRRSYSSQIKLNITTRRGLVEIQGSARSLKWLAKIIQAYAYQNFPDDFWIKPKGPGHSYFSSNSKFGIYLYNTDFRNSKRATKAAA